MVEAGELAGSTPDPSSEPPVWRQPPMEALSGKLEDSWGGFVIGLLWMGLPASRRRKCFVVIWTLAFAATTTRDSRLRRAVAVRVSESGSVVVVEQDLGLLLESNPCSAVG
jgi:hypothetical protein